MITKELDRLTRKGGMSPHLFACTEQAVAILAQIHSDISQEGSLKVATMIEEVLGEIRGQIEQLTVIINTGELVYKYGISH